MSNSTIHRFILFALAFGLILWPVSGLAEPRDVIRVEVSLMDDHGFLLADYQTDYFSVVDNQFVYQEPTTVPGYTFATVNVLKLETDSGFSFRVNYFYTRDEEGSAQLPDPVPMDEIPMKRVQLQRRPVWISRIDEFSKELSDSRVMDLDFFWETYVVPEPLELRGYVFKELRTGTKKHEGESIPHFAYVYDRAGQPASPPSLIFEHLIETGSLRTIPREPTVPPIPSTRPDGGTGTKPAATSSAAPATPPTVTSVRTDPAATGADGPPNHVTNPTATMPDAGGEDRPTEDPADDGRPLIFLAGLALVGGAAILAHRYSRSGR